MPALIRVGPHADTRVGHSARAWSVRRSGSRVFVRWGPVNVVQLALGRTRYVWYRSEKLPRLLVYRCRTIAAATRKRRELVNKKLRHGARHDGYVRLPAGTVILLRRPSTKP